MIEFKTESGSTYEVDSQAKRYRCKNKGLRLASEWSTYDLCTEIKQGERVTFFVNDDDVSRTYTTQTSPVVEITRNDMVEVEITTGEDN
jgi:hypothetical protein